MHSSKLIKIYKSLNKKELKLFKKWIQSPIHNEHKDVQQLFLFLLSRYNLSAKILKKERAWKYIYPSKTYDDLRMRHVMSFSLNVLEEFVSYFESKKTNLKHQKRLTKAYFDKNLLKPAAQALKKTEAELNKYFPKDETYHYHQYELEVLKFNIEGTQDRTRATNISAIANQASLFFMTTTLRYAYTALSHQNLKKTDYQMPLLDSVLKEVKEKDYSAYPILMIYYHGYQTLHASEDSFHFKQLNYYLEQPNNLLGEKERQSVLLMALNYAIKQLNTGSDFYIKEAFRLYQKGLAEHLLIQNNQMSHFAYKNIVSLGIILKEYDWLDSFIPTYAEKLDGKSKENYRDYSLARLTFARGDFDQAMSLLIQADYDDLFLSINAKVMLLKLYYQQEYWDSLEALLESFRIYMNRKKELSYHKKHYTNLILLTKKIMNIPSHNKTEIKKITAQIKTTHPLAEREWLLSQIEKK